jgi:ABC-type branched-subunit amino acid transport system ATPase component
MTSNELDVKSVRVSFGPVVALADVDLTVAGGVTAIIGPNGSGKTTLLNAVSGLVPIAAGAIYLNGRPIHSLPVRRRALLRIGRTFQTSRILEWSNLRENVAIGDFGSPLHGNLAKSLMQWPAKTKLAEEALGRVGLEGRGEERASVLSFGERKLLELARLSVSKPDVVLLDEPVSGLHASTKTLVRTIVSEMSAAGATVLFVEHDHEFVRSVARRVVSFSKGRVVADGGLDVLDDAAALFAGG